MGNFSFVGAIQFYYILLYIFLFVCVIILQKFCLSSQILILVPVVLEKKTHHIAITAKGEKSRVSFFVLSFTKSCCSQSKYFLFQSSESCSPLKELKDPENKDICVGSCASKRILSVQSPTLELQHS